MGAGPERPHTWSSVGVSDRRPGDGDQPFRLDPNLIQPLTALGDRARILLRRTTIGFVFQSFGLIPFLTAAENASLPLRIARADPAAARERVARVLDLVGLAGQAEH